MKGKIQIHIKRGQFKKDADTFGKMDPYIQVKIGQVTRKTKVANNAGKNPQWQDILQFDINNDQQKATFTAKDQQVLSDQMLGMNILGLNSFMKMQNKWHDLDLDLLYKDKEIGKIYLSIKLQDTLKGTVIVTLKNGIFERDTDTFGKMDPYCLLKMGTQEHKSKVHSGGGKQPEWNEDFEFDVIDFKNDLSIVVMDKDKLSSDDLVGQGKLQAKNLLNKGKIQVRMNYKSKQVGVVNLQVKKKH